VTEINCPACHSTLRVEAEIVRIAPPTPTALRVPPQLHDSLHREAVEVVCRVAAEHGLALSDLRGPGRRGRLVKARRCAAAAARAHTDVSLPQLGRILNRDHSTVLSLVRTAERSDLVSQRAA
jgi:chromosomal replication initiation ATPase DnaA